jgi:hypothetical protein
MTEMAGQVTALIAAAGHGLREWRRRRRQHPPQHGTDTGRGSGSVDSGRGGHPRAGNLTQRLLLGPEEYDAT